MKILSSPFSEWTEDSWVFRRKHGGTIIRIEVENIPPQDEVPHDRRGQMFYAVMDVGGRQWDSLTDSDKLDLMKQHWQTAYAARRAA